MKLDRESLTIAPLVVLPPRLSPRDVIAGRGVKGTASREGSRLLFRVTYDGPAPATWDPSSRITDLEGAWLRRTRRDDRAAQVIFDFVLPWPEQASLSLSFTFDGMLVGWSGNVCEVERVFLVTVRGETVRVDEGPSFLPFEAQVRGLAGAGYFPSGPDAAEWAAEAQER
jgi:hypothetical protein